MKTILGKYPNIANHYMLIGQGGVFREPTTVQTVLGSCVSVTFFSKRHGIGGMFHALLPAWRGYESSLASQNRYKYVDSAIHGIFDELSGLGVARSDLTCKIFGGASALMQGEFGAGIKNVQSAFVVLSELQLKVAASNVGGNKGRKIVFISHTGEVYVKQLNSARS